MLKNDTLKNRTFHKGLYGSTVSPRGFAVIAALILFDVLGVPKILNFE